MPKKKKTQYSKSSEIKKIDAPELEKNVDSDDSGIDLSRISKNQWISISVLTLFIVVFFLAFRENDKKIIDEWYKALYLVDSGRKSNDAELKIKLMEQGGNQLKELVQKYPFHARVNYFLGYYYMHKENLDSAIKYFKTSYSLDSGATINAIWKEVASDIVYCYKKKSEKTTADHDFTNSLIYLKEALRYEPFEAQTNFFIGNTFLNLNMPDSALPHYIISIKYDPKNTEAMNNLGYIYVRKQDYKTAAEYFRKVLMINPNNELARQNLNAINEGIKFRGEGQ